LSFIFLRKRSESSQSRKEVTEMAGAIDTLLSFGIGALSMTRGRAQKVVDELVKKGEVRLEESKALIDRMTSRGEEERAELRKLIEEELERAKTGIATRADACHVWRANMEKYCPFLETGPRWQGGSLYRCTVGVNFCSVGERRELCRICPIADLGQALLCEHLDVYTFLQVDAEGGQSIRVEMECRAPEDEPVGFCRCEICPKKRAMEPDDIQDIGWQGAIQ
jgi:polyhydroxyalkanoate synthesis regulator phasin